MLYKPGFSTIWVRKLVSSLFWGIDDSKHYKELSDCYSLAKFPRIENFIACLVLAQKQIHCTMYGMQDQGCPN